MSFYLIDFFYKKKSIVPVKNRTNLICQVSATSSSEAKLTEIDFGFDGIDHISILYVYNLKF